MMQVSEITQRFNRIEHTISETTQTCQFDSSVPQDLKDCVQQLDQQSNQVKQALQSQDQNHIRRQVSSLEVLGDRAKQACQLAGEISPQIKNAVKQVHDEVSILKRQLLH